MKKMLLIGGLAAVASLLGGCMFVCEDHYVARPPCVIYDEPPAVIYGPPCAVVEVVPVLPCPPPYWHDHYYYHHGRRW
jgi:hypothetical protein